MIIRVLLVAVFIAIIPVIGSAQVTQRFPDFVAGAPSVSTLNPTDLIPIVRGGATYKAQVSQFNTLSGPTPPPQATAAGYTVLARNSDFRLAAPDIGCDVADLTSHHDWYGFTYGSIYSDCSNITWPAVDPVSGETTAKFNCTDCGKPSVSFTGARHGLSSINDNGSQGDSFPMDGYYECRMRVDPYRFQGGWWNCWMNGLQWVQTAGSTLWLELDINEYHSGLAENKNYCNIQALHDWFGDSTGPVSWYTCNTGLDPSDGMHTTGMLVTTNRAAGTVKFCAYYDDVFKGCTGDYTPFNTAWKAQRNFIMWNVTVGCASNQETYGDCINTPISNVTNNGGNIRIAINGSNTPTYGLPLVATGFDEYMLSISGVTGTTNANGHFMGVAVDDPSTCTTNCRFDIFAIDPATGGPGAPITFNAPYTGGGVWNPAPNGLNLYASFFRVWVACTAWQTTNCATAPPAPQRGNNVSNECSGPVSTCAATVIGSATGDMRIVGVYYGRTAATVTSSDLTSLQDNHGNVCARVSGSPGPFKLRSDNHRATDIWKCPITSGASSSIVTATFAQAQDYVGVYVSEIYGSSITDPGIANGAASTGTAVSVTTNGAVTQVGEYIYNFVAVTGLASTNGATVLDSNGGLIQQYKLTTTSSGTATINATAGTSGPWISSVAAFVVTP